MSQNLKKNYQKLLQEIQNKVFECKRKTNAVQLLIVSKGQSVSSLQSLYELGQVAFGENYVQEWKEKEKNISNLPIEWHFTGHLQSNKLKDLVGKITYFHSIDRLSLAQEINKLAKKRQVVCKGFVEVNLAQEPSKAGISESKLEAFLEDLNSLPFLEIIGLMIIPPASHNAEDSRPYFKQLREILFALNEKKIYRKPLTELSMGMSNDFPIAIEEGATWVRVGRKIFAE